MAKRNGEEPNALMTDFPTVEDGVRGMQFVETVVESGNDHNAKWIKWLE